MTPRVAAGRKISRAAALIAACLLGLAAAPAARAGDLPVLFEEGVVYARPGGRPLELDYAVPARGRGPFPVVLCIHGGGWRAGKRQGFDDLVRRLAARGFAAVTMSYRLTPAGRWPDQMEDVRSALAWIERESPRLALDPHRIAALGASAGGHLALMAGLLPDAARGDHRLVEAVVNYFGPTEMTRDGVFRPEIDPLVVDLAGGPRKDLPHVYAALSPVTHVTRGDPPVLTFHGTEDPIVPVEQARILHRTLESAGVISRLELLEGKGHGWGGEDRARTEKEAVAFLDAYLRGGPLPLILAEDFDDGIDRWEPTDPAAWAWAAEGGRRYLAMVSEKSDYRPKVRSPRGIALLKGIVVRDFVLDVDLQYTHKDYGHASLCLFFGHQDPEHYYYVHLGKRADAHANSIFIVDGKPRVSIARTRTDGTDWDRAWHRVRIRRDTSSGGIEVFFDDMEKPVMTAEDRTFLWGRVGVGSFDDKGNFDTIRLRGVLR